MRVLMGSHASVFAYIYFKSTYADFKAQNMTKVLIGCRLLLFLLSLPFLPLLPVITVITTMSISTISTIISELIFLPVAWVGRNQFGVLKF